MLSTLFILVIVIAIEAAPLKYTCDAKGYDGYLTEFNHKLKDLTDIEGYKRDHLDSFVKSCEYIKRKSAYIPYEIKFTDLSDWSDVAVQSLSDIGIYYSGDGSYFEPKEHTRNEFTFGTHMDFLKDEVCLDLAKYSREDVTIEKQCSISWVSATIAAIESALKNQLIDYNDPLSYQYLMNCVPRYAGTNDFCSGIAMKDVLAFIAINDMFSQEDYEVIMSSYPGLKCPGEPNWEKAVEGLTTYKVSFEASYPNMGYLMENLDDKKPTIVTLAVNLMKLRFITNMGANDDRIPCSAYEPSLMGIVTGYKYSPNESEDDWWQIEAYPTFCYHMTFKMPMNRNETSSNYAGIAGFAYTLDVTVDVPTEPPTTDVPPTEAPTTDVPPTEAPTEPPTEAPTTELPTEVPTTEPPLLSDQFFPYDETKGGMAYEDFKKESLGNMTVDAIINSKIFAYYITNTESLYNVFVDKIRRLNMKKPDNNTRKDAVFYIDKDDTLATRFSDAMILAHITKARTVTVVKEGLTVSALQTYTAMFNEKFRFKNLDIYGGNELNNTAEWKTVRIQSSHAKLIVETLCDSAKLEELESVRFYLPSGQWDPAIEQAVADAKLSTCSVVFDFAIGTYPKEDVCDLYDASPADQEKCKKLWLGQ